MFDKFKEECGVFGIIGHPEAAHLTYLGLYALQHRGQESAGIASSDGARIRHLKAMGHVNEAFSHESLAKLPGTQAIGHVRYSTAGDSKLTNAQPIVIDCMHGSLALCHNGNLVNANEVRDALVRQGAIFQTAYAPFFPPQLASFLFALSFVLFWLGILWVLYRRGIFLKV